MPQGGTLPVVRSRRQLCRPWCATVGSQLRTWIRRVLCSALALHLRGVAVLRTRARMEKLEKRVNEVGFLCIGSAER